MYDKFINFQHLNILDSNILQKLNVIDSRKIYDVVSCQFALHYFFENKHTCNAFLRNISECCKVGGYFIGTCYDGKKLFRLLEEKNEEESISKYNNGQKIWEVQKMYDKDEFKDDATSFGYAINVYQESINKSFKEYLVNFNYLTILETTPAPIVRPPSRIANRIPDSIATG